MSHQSGITGSEETQAALADFLGDEGQRAMKIVIKDEKLTADGILPRVGDYEADYDACVPSLVEEREPCYVLYRLDTEHSNGSDFIFIAWSPDFAHIRQKMLYASTRATLKTMVGLQYIKEELFGTVMDDVNLGGYKKHLIAASAPPPLTDEELEKKEIRAAETGVEIGASTKRSMATGISFPVSDDGIDKLTQLKNDQLTYVALSVDTSNEVINLELAESFECDDIRATIPSDHARYHIFNFKHNHEGDSLQSLVFVYSCPGYKIPVKERMLFSSAKAPLIDAMEQDLGLSFEKKLEIGDADEFTTEWLYDQLHPAKTVFKQKFARPARPGKGGRRLTRRTDSSKAVDS